MATVLGELSDVNRVMGLCKEGTQQAKEASGIFERLGDAVGQAGCLINLAHLLRKDGQLDAAEEAASRGINILPEKGQELWVCVGHRTLGDIYHKGGDTDKAIHNYKIALAVTSSLNPHSELSRVHLALAVLFFGEGQLDEAHAHIEQAKLHAVNDAYLLAHASLLQAMFWYVQDMFEEAKSGALRALDAYEKFGVADVAEGTREFLERIDRDARGSGLGPSRI